MALTKSSLQPWRLKLTEVIVHGQVGSCLLCLLFLLTTGVGGVAPNSAGADISEGAKSSGKGSHGRPPADSQKKHGDGCAYKRRKLATSVAEPIDLRKIIAPPPAATSDGEGTDDDDDDDHGEVSIEKSQ